MSSKSVHFTPIALCESDGAAPEYIQILPTGSITPNDGRKPWSMDDPQAVIEATRQALGGLELLVDYNHQSEHAARNGKPAPAAGWITALEARPQGIFGKVKWTERGAEAVKAREFRYISPVFSHDAQGRIKRIVSCALTNTPALDMAALCEAGQSKSMEVTGMDPKLVAQALGMAETAGEAEIIAACAEARKAQCEAQKEPDLELNPKDYALAQEAIAKGAKYRQDERNIAYVLEDPAGMVVIVKATMEGDELYVTSLYPGSFRSTHRDEL